MTPTYNYVIIHQYDHHQDAINAVLIMWQHCVLEVIKWMISNAVKINNEGTQFIIFNSTNVPLTS